MVLELKLDLSESVANEVRARSLLEAPAMERMLRAELKRNPVDQLFAAADKLAARELLPMTELELQEEIKAVRASRH
jgi:hypothetical protein